MTRSRLATSLGPVLNAGVIALALLFAACSQEARPVAEAPRALPAKSAPAAGEPVPAAGAARALYDEVGIASWYGGRHQGRRTASGERFDRRLLTAAHRFLPLGTVVRVQNLDNGRSLRLRITDRGPYVAGRILDLSEAAARRLGLERQGLGLVALTILPKATPLQLAAER